MKSKAVGSRVSLPLAAIAVLVIGGVLYAGPLDPPPGPVTSTGKTLAEVEPRIAINATNTPGDATSVYKITQPGSYYLPRNVGGAAGKHGIVIATGGVTVDLNGFEVAGVPDSLVGVMVFTGAAANITIRNGTVRDWGADGVNTRNSGTINARVEQIIATGNTDYGIFVAAGTLVADCVTGGNGVTGIQTQDGCIVRGCTARGNVLTGIAVGFGCSIIDCSVVANSGNGINAFGNCTITGTSAHSNSGSGIVAGFSSVTNCTAGNNAVHGISSPGGSLVVSGCTAFGNSQNGIDGGPGCTVSGTVASGNTQSGISVGTGCTLIGNTLRLNGLDGIVGATGNTIRGNTCVGNGNSGDSAGIHVTGGDNRIEDNNCTTADRGIDVDVAGNFIVRNTCSGNGVNWTIVGGNVLGPILDRTAPGNVAINGNTGASTLSSTEPNANFTY